VLAPFGGHALIASQQVDILWTVHMLTKEHPKPRSLWDHRGEKALHGTKATPFAGPPGKAQHRDAPSHDQHGQSHPTGLAQGRLCHIGLEALAKYANAYENYLEGREWQSWWTTTLRSISMVSSMAIACAKGMVGPEAF